MPGSTPTGSLDGKIAARFAAGEALLRRLLDGNVIGEEHVRLILRADGRLVAGMDGRPDDDLNPILKALMARASFSLGICDRRGLPNLDDIRFGPDIRFQDIYSLGIEERFEMASGDVLVFALGAETDEHANPPEKRTICVLFDSAVVEPACLARARTLLRAAPDCAPIHLADLREDFAERRRLGAGDGDEAGSARIIDSGRLAKAEAIASLEALEQERIREAAAGDSVRNDLLRLRQDLSGDDVPPLVGVLIDELDWQAGNVFRRSVAVETMGPIARAEFARIAAHCLPELVTIPLGRPDDRDDHLVGASKTEDLVRGLFNAIPPHAPEVRHPSYPLHPVLYEAVTDPDALRDLAAGWSLFQFCYDDQEPEFEQGSASFHEMTERTSAWQDASAALNRTIERLALLRHDIGLQPDDGDSDSFRRLSMRQRRDCRKANESPGGAEQDAEQDDSDVGF
jgi:hypothetical protein